MTPGNRLFLKRSRSAASAKDQLLKGSKVTEAAFASGYKSFAHFITVFRRLTLEFPSEVARVGSNQ